MFNDMRSRIGMLLAVFGITISGCVGSSYPDRHSYSVYSERAAAHAQKMIGIRYRYGGNHPSRGFDCSGLVQYSYRLAGLKVPRNTKYQLRGSRRIPASRLRRGDLLFFHLEGKRFSHVGIYIGNKRFVHAPSTGKNVRVSTLNNRYWRRHLASTRRFKPF